MSLIIKTSKSWSNAHPSSSWTSWAAWGRATGHTRPWVIDGGPIITRPFVTVTYTKWVPLSFLPFTTTSFPSTPFPSYIVTNTHHSLSRHPFVPQTYTHSAHHIPRNIVNNTTNTNPLSLSLSLPLCFSPQEQRMHRFIILTILLSLALAGNAHLYHFISLFLFFHFCITKLTLLSYIVCLFQMEVPLELTTVV